MKWGQKVTLSLLFVLVITLLSLAEERPSVIPYQGQLADQEGNPVSPAEAITLVLPYLFGAYRRNTNLAGGTRKRLGRERAVQRAARGA